MSSSWMVAGSGRETLAGVRIEEIEGRGRGVVSTQPLKAGQIVLRDSPILLYSALPLSLKEQQSPSSSDNYYYCDNCFRTIHPIQSAVSCPSCSHHHFCSPTCLSSFHSRSHSHSANSNWVCQALSRCASSLLHRPLPLDRQLQARFLIAAYNLALFSPSHFQILLSLHGQPSEDVNEDGKFLHSLISSVCPPPSLPSFSLELTSALLAKDKLNAFGLMEPFSFIQRNSGQRSVRAYGIYPKSSFFNHDCLPNACRFDYVDTASGDAARSNTDIIVRMIHDVPQGREICLSYFPVNENYATRQKRLLQDYGFTCNCDRCMVEANWSDNDNGDDDNEELEEIEDDGDNDVMELEENQDEATMDVAASGDESDFPHSYFFLRYMCNRENCWGTLAPLPPSHSDMPSLLECNVCGFIKNDEFVAADDGLPQCGLSMNH